jgi:hypothetical protein
MINPTIMNILRPLAPHLRQFLYSVLILFALINVCYCLCFFLGYIYFFQALLSKAGVFLGARALSFFLIKIGCSGGLALAIGFAVRALLAAEAAPPFGNAVSPGREPELNLHLGQPGVQVEDPEGLSTAERALRTRLTLDGRHNISLDDVQAMVSMKEDILSRIALLDPNPFWANQRDEIISRYIVTPSGHEYSLPTLERIWRELAVTNDPNHPFLKKMIKLRKNFELLGRFY